MSQVRFPDGWSYIALPVLYLKHQGERIRMLISVPITENGDMNSSVSDHFGKAPAYLLIDSMTMNARTIPNRSDHMGGIGTPPERMAKEKVDVVICSGLGPKALKALMNNGIKVYVGATGTAKEAIAIWQAGGLQIASDENACKSHHH
jgi:predicted Fe-Mo cluster-binding NifX family protein